MKSLFLVASVFLSLNCFAVSPEEVATVEASDCRTDAQDPNDIGYRLTANSRLYSQGCIDGKKFRPIRNLSLANETAVFNNYLHNNQFWKAQIPVDVSQIETVYFQVMRFPVVEGVIAAHTQIRFVFKNKTAVQLTHLDPSTGIEQTNSSEDILISFEAAFPNTVNYNFALGAFPNYARVAKVMSTIQKETDSPSGIEQYELKLTAEEKALLLKNTLVYAQNMGIEEFYNTLRPNCTTEVFDQLDQLPSLKGKNKKFLTMISADPIAGPSIKALNQRNLIVKRVQNYGDEIKGVRETLAMPVAQKSAMTTFLPEVAGQPWTMTTILPDMSKMSESEKQAMLSLQSELVKTIPTLIQSYAAVMMLAPKETKGQKLFLSTLKEIVSRAPALLRKVNGQLPEERTEISLYFTPYETEQTSTDLSQFGILAEIPFAMNNVQIDNSTRDAREAGREIYNGVSFGIMKASDNLNRTKDSKAYLMSATIVIHAQKDNSQVVTQILAGLAPMESPLASESPQVKIKKVVVPEHSGIMSQPAMLITHAQEVKNEAINEFVDVQFGAFGGLGNEQSQYGNDTLEIYKGSVFCNAQASSTPYFEGNINDKFMGKDFVDNIVKGGPISFNLMRMSLNLKTMAVVDMELKISALWVLSCLSDSTANKEFTANANKALTDMMNKANNSDVLQMLSPLLN